jgi:ABC-2 type transport system permease protein
MTTQAQSQPLAQPTPRSIGTFVSETGALYMRSIRKLLRRPVVLYFSLVQPLIWLLLFGQIFSRLTQFPGAAQAFGGTSYFQFFMPAVVLQTILFGAAQSGIGIITDMDSGFLDKLLTTPINRMAILLGKILGDLTRMILQGVLIILITWGIGQFQSERVSYTYGIPGIFGALGIALLFGLGLAGFNVFIALKTRNTEATFLIANFLTLPLLFTSSAQLPLQLLPNWLQTVARFNPVTYTIDAMRVLLNGQQSSVADTPQAVLLLAIAILSVIAAVTLTLAVRSFRRSVR